MLSLTCWVIFGNTLGTAADSHIVYQPSKRGELSVEVLGASARPGDVDLHLTLTNKSREVIVNTWRHHRLDGLDFQVTDEKGKAVKTRLFVPINTELQAEPNYLVLKPGESRDVPINLLSVVADGSLPAGRYKVKAVYLNTFQGEVYTTKEVEVIVPARR
jgi:hypothetical protein